MNVRLLFALPPLVFAPLAYGQAGGQALQPLFACRAITEDAARLACLDAAVAELQAASESGDVVAVDRQQIEAAEESTFGLSIPNFSLPSLRGDNPALAEAGDAEVHSPDRVVTRNDDGDIERIEGLAVTEVTINRAGRVEVTLANGQMWRQTDGTMVQGVRSGARPGLTANIRGGALGSYFMRLNNGGRWFRAERIQ
jgi:hypothetical protein